MIDFRYHLVSLIAVFLAVASGSVVARILGALFAVPLLAMVNSVIRYLSSRGWEHDPDIAWQPYLYPWEIRRKAKAKELTREEVLQQFRRFSRTRRNEEAKSRNKEAEKDVTQRERDRALEAADRVSETERRRHARQKEHHGAANVRDWADLAWRIKTSSFATFCTGFFQSSVVIFLPAYLHFVKGVPEEDTTLVTAVSAGGMLVISNVAGSRPGCSPSMSSSTEAPSSGSVRTLRAL